MKVIIYSSCYSREENPAGFKTDLNPSKELEEALNTIRSLNSINRLVVLFFSILETYRRQGSSGLVIIWRSQLFLPTFYLHSPVFRLCPVSQRSSNMISPSPPSHWMLFVSYFRVVILGQAKPRLVRTRGQFQLLRVQTYSNSVYAILRRGYQSIAKVCQIPPVFIN